MALGEPPPWRYLLTKPPGRHPTWWLTRDRPVAWMVLETISFSYAAVDSVGDYPFCCIGPTVGCQRLRHAQAQHLSPMRMVSETISSAVALQITRRRPQVKKQSQEQQRVRGIRPSTGIFSVAAWMVLVTITFRPLKDFTRLRPTSKRRPQKPVN